MTLLLTTVCNQYVVQASDGRLSAQDRRGNYVTIADMANKAVVVDGDFARFAVAFTGPAVLGRAVHSQPFPATAMAIGDALMDMGADGLRIEQIVPKLSVWLGNTLARSRDGHDPLPMTVVLAGFARDHDHSAVPFYCDVTNYFRPNPGAHFNVREEFTDYLEFLPPTREGFMMRGTEQAFTHALQERARKLQHRGFLSSGNIPGIEKCMVRMIRDASMTPHHGKFVGQNCITVSISFVPGKPGIRCLNWGRKPDHVYTMNPLIIRPGVASRIFHTQGLGDLSSGGTFPVTIGRPRNTDADEKCVCGSGLKYKHCCTHRDSPPQPMDEASVLRAFQTIHRELHRGQ